MVSPLLAAANGWLLAVVVPPALPPGSSWRRTNVNNAVGDLRV
jgi:hypothetical protein